MKQQRNANKANGKSCYEIALKEMRKKRPDIQIVMELLDQGIRSGDPRAAYALATWYLHGTNVKRNLSKGIKLLRRAANAGVPEALHDLAYSYESGKGVKKNLRTAIQLYLRAALAGDKQSVFEVGRCYYHGIGIETNRRLAWIWLDHAKTLGITV